jgi:antitoxin component of RelBE/YafQ-DinJ toxin-antitoxin module
MSARFNVNDLLEKPVYDVSSYGEDLQLPFGQKKLALQSITWSALDELLVVGADMENYSRLVSDIDSLGIMTQGDGVAFDQTYTWLSDMSAFVYKFNITLCVALDVTAYTSGNHSVDSVNVIIKETLADDTVIRTIADLTQDTGMTNTQAVETKACIMTFEGNIPFKVAQGNKVTVQIILNRTDTNTATSFEGIMPLFYFQISDLAKTMIESTMQLHLHPALDHAFEVFRDQSIQEQLDYDGVNIEGVKR